MKKRELKELIEQGEGYFVEFKEQIGVGLDKEMVAFANASGGKIVIGVADNGKIIGCTADNKVRSKIQDIANNCDSRISIHVGIHDNRVEISNPGRLLFDKSKFGKLSVARDIEDQLENRVINSCYRQQSKSEGVIMDIFEFMKEKNIARLDFLKNSEPSARDVVNASTYPAFKKMMAELGHEEVVFFYDKAINARFIVGIHSTLRGPSLGGLRLWAYEKEFDAVKDVLRLSRGMTYKSASVNLDLGGGKAVAWLDERGKTPELLKSFANFLITLEGRYITAEDVGTSVEDMDFMLDEIKSKTDKVCVVCCSEARGGSGNPSPFTAHGVYDGIKLSVKRVFGKDLLKGLTIALQGLGHVGFEVAKKLIDDGVNLVVSELEEAKIKRVQDYAGSKVGFRVVGIDEIYSVDCDLFSPNALGGILNDKTIPQLRCKIVAGAANNQLEDEEKHSELLYKRGIFYSPDFMINAGGVSNAAMEVFDKMHNIAYDKESVFKKVDEISNNLLDAASISEKENISTYKAALKLAEQRLR